MLLWHWRPCSTGTGIQYPTLTINPRISLYHVSPNIYTHYQALYTVRLHCKAPKQMAAYQSGRQFVPFLWWSLVWPGWGVNLLSSASEVNTLTTLWKVSIFKSQCFSKILTGTKLYALIHFDRKNFVFIKLWYKNNNRRIAWRTLLFQQRLLLKR